MKTGDSMYISPFVPHTFTSRNKQSNGLILALTYGNKLTGDVKQELSGLSTEAGSQFSLDFSTKEKASAALLKFHREILSLPINEVSIRTKIPAHTIIELENAKRLPTHDEIILLARSYNVNSRELIADDKIEKKVVVKPHNECKKWYYPDNSKIYEFVELASITSLPFSKAFEINVQNSDISDYDFKVGLHQFIYNVGENELMLNWEFNDKKHTKLIQPGDSIYIKPFIKHNFRGNGKLIVLRVGGRIPGDSQRELSLIGGRNTKRAISETMQWFDPHGKN
jgi:methylphosphonate synthase